MKSYTLYIYGIIILALCSCHHVGKNDCQIELQLQKPASLIYLSECLPEGNMVIDSTEGKKGVYTFTLHNVKPSIYRIHSADTDTATGVHTNNGFQVLVQAGNKIQLRADNLSNPHLCRISGSPETEALLELDNRLYDLYLFTDSLAQIFEEHKYLEDFDSIRTELDTQVNNRYAMHQTYLKQFIAQHFTSLVSLIAFYQACGRHRFFSTETDHDLLVEIYNHLSQQYPENKHVIALQNRLELFDLMVNKDSLPD